MDYFELSGFIFNHICKITPVCNSDGKAIEFCPQPKYQKRKLIALNRNGSESFCKFKIPPTGSVNLGVYILTVEGKLVYIGRCENLENRFNNGYGNISPKNCYKGGQSTNCRVNKLILEVTKQKKKVDLYFLQTDEMHSIEKKLIQNYKPQWNEAR